MIKQIFVDLDDTLNSLTMHILHHFGCASHSLAYDEYPTHLGFACSDAYNLLKKPGQPDLDHTEFWRAVPSDVWISAPKSPQFDQILDGCQMLAAKANIHVLTAMPPDLLDRGRVAAAKYAWINENLPPWLAKNVFIGSCKHACASPQSLLIDDADHNIRAFGEFGHTMIVPRPWNTYHKHATQQFLRESFSYHFTQHTLNPRNRV